MKETINKMKELYDKVFSFFQNDKLQKRTRITYGVFWNLLLLFIIVAIIGLSFAGGIGAGYFASLVKDEPIRTYAEMKKDIYDENQTSKLYFANNVYLGKMRTELEREEVSVGQVSDYLKNGLIATEDEYFYEHHGIVPKALFRAIFQEMTNSSTQSGGSTLTQQVIKNQILTNEVSFDRKAKEVLLALRLEKFFTKDQILDAYLNDTSFGRNSSGRNIAGVQTAAKGIFGVSAKDLNLPQSAFIAGLPQSPFGYTPFTNQGTLKKNLEPGINRMKTVLKRMRDNGYINDKEYQDALHYDIKKDFITAQKSPSEKYPWLVDEIEKRSQEIIASMLAKKDGYSEEALQKNKALYEKYQTLANRNIRQNGYKIHTTVVKAIYDKMQKAKNEFQGYGPIRTLTYTDPKTGKEKKRIEPVQIGAMLIENKTGKILSFVGGRDFKLEQLNHATQGKRPNGSTMKPLLVYGPSLELGKISPGSMIADTKFSIQAGGKEWSPENYTIGREYGLVTARQALANSYNISAAKTYLNIINQRPADYLKKMGITSLTDGDYYNPSLSLGGITNGVTVEENVNAYATFANGGQFVDAYLIDRIVDKNGKTIYQHESKPVPVFSPQTSYLALDMMRDVLGYGTAASVRSMLKFSADWAGKTGTTQDWKDAWFVATNPNVTFGTWIGYDTPSDLRAANYPNYSIRNLQIWSKLMNAAYDADPKMVAPKDHFTMPGGIVRKSYCAISGDLPSKACSVAGLVKSDLFNAKYAPTKEDDSLIDGKYVTINGKNYLALDSTPSEFAHTGFLLNPDFIKNIGADKEKDLSKLIPNNPIWSKVLVPDAKITDDGKPPLPVKVTKVGNLIKWTESPSPDVVGYRVYRKDGKKLAAVRSGDKLVYPFSSSDIYVVAVDVAGNESSHSNVVQIDIEPPNDGSKDDKVPDDKKENDDNLDIINGLNH
ncbi:transglycosylase domain-containing protein [Bacillus sp. FJAT-49736]|uniref:transglycosylase domain-containing protein n=1 Tax=Bacillus sp. FJAT-49736 TaxID=2833582 RepID=UPI001BCA49BA|nr:transglycosylase domain-containing protein [Bacillus sp. FJAT-49736]MBS4173839.1 penicillin-binding protein [Bacillus sp. FJAT-49736]